ncbi:uncharacterized protein LOC130641622 [Hydractinia symbiolongicarpus]|uniref:uncharacterized protein LOC130641622 n=1 Tax=Hydractinia symbiolongicarpus TaxID=13093 RepID=UPI00254E23D7|nr:uncharacterized protein LOC130641622 [Hydractinia symbiolongicarpus]
MSKSVANIFDEYPILVDPVQLMDESNRLTYFDLPVMWSEYFSETKVKTILKLSPPKTFRVDSLMSAIDTITEKTDKASLGSLAIILVPALLRDDAKSLFSNFDVKREPQIMCASEVITIVEVALDKQFKVVVDGCIVAECSEFISAFQVYLASLYLFNLCCPKNLTATLTFFQKDVLNLHND